MKVLRRVYPVLFALFPGLSMLAANAGEVEPADAWRVLALSGVVAVVLMLVWYALLRDPDQAAALSLVVLVPLFSYGHLYNEIKNLALLGLVIGRHRYLLPAVLLLMGATTGMILRRGVPFSVSRLLAVIVSALVAVSLVMVLPLFIQAAAMHGPSPAEMASGGDTGDRAGQELRPDIYYIVLDGYGRSDILRELYALDNQPFLDFLQARGFYVAPESRANYSATIMSLAASLNMQYPHEWPERTLGPRLARQYLRDRIRHSDVRRLLEERGYRVVAFETGVPTTEWHDADVYLRPKAVRGPFNAFEVMFLETTVARAVIDLYFARDPGYRTAVLQPEYENHRIRIRYTLSHLADIARMPGDYFVFAHVVSPHPPFVFGPKCERLPAELPYRLVDGNHYPGGRDEYIARYRDQATCLTALVQDALDDLLRASEVPPVVILQSDHGPGAYLDLASPERSYLPERFGVLMAVLLPDGRETTLHPGITPVNVFRAVFGAQFGVDLPLLPDRSYFVSLDHVFDVTEVTQELHLGGGR